MLQDFASLSLVTPQQQLLDTYTNGPPGVHRKINGTCNHSVIKQPALLHGQMSNKSIQQTFDINLNSYHMRVENNKMS